MQIRLVMQPEKPLVIPFNYNYQLQSALYAMLGEVGESDFWHDNGFGDTAKFKGFCFGKLNGRYHADTAVKKLCFADEVKLEVRSPSFAFIDSFQRALEQTPFLKLFDTRLNVTDAALFNKHLPGGSVKLTAVTPVVIHRTLPDGHTFFFTPEDDEFYEGICNNAARKYESITGQASPEILLSPLGEFKKTVTKYKDFYITGYTGSFEIKTELKVTEFLYNAGLGEKNSQGFGFVEEYVGLSKPYYGAR